MHLESLALTHFRNYASREVGFDPGINLLAAPNGHGKTNLLEAIHFGCLAHSQRTRKDKELIEWSAAAFVLRLEGEVAGRPHVQSVEYTEGGHKRVKVNGSESRRLSDLIGHFSVVSFSPEDLDLIRGAPQGRRRFLDILLCQGSLDYLDLLRRYNAALKQRNSLLRSFWGGGGTGRPMDRREAEETLKAFDTPLAETGARITAHRRRVLADLAPLAAACYHDIAAAAEPLEMSLAGAVSEAKDVDSARDEFLARLAATRVSEREAGSTLCGPHREDLLFFLAGKPLREYGSQGQKRTVSLSLKLASARLLESERGAGPILLLDDVFAELDEGRRGRIGELIRGKGQVFIANPRPADLPFVADRIISLEREAAE
ncbi:MAG TPA: DNA replication/repair protein RecF [Fibrobacteria bacterium]|nr:DNA replication/repair protein RecF [Fibrobacteria bacterium]